MITTQRFTIDWGNGRSIVALVWVGLIVRVTPGANRVQLVSAQMVSTAMPTN